VVFGKYCEMGHTSPLYLPYISPISPLDLPIYLPQVVFGEYCEMGACCLKWEEGPPKIWRAALDFALC